MITTDQFFSQPLPEIAFIGKTRAGKDLAFKILCEMGFDVKRIAFGDVMKEKFFELFPHIPLEPKPTQELIHFGQSMRVIDPEIWVRLTLGRLTFGGRVAGLYDFKPETAIFTDVRQQNEYDSVKARGALLVRLHAPEDLRVQRMLELGETVSKEVLEAPTEKTLEGFECDYNIYNHGDIGEFYRDLVELIYQIQSGGIASWQERKRELLEK